MLAKLKKSNDACTAYTWPMILIFLLQHSDFSCNIYSIIILIMLILFNNFENSIGHHGKELIGILGAE